MERRRKPAGSRGVKPKAPAATAAPNLSLPTLADFIDDGQITIGTLRPVGCVAAAADEDVSYVMLVRRQGETLLQLLTRLDQCLDKALTLGIFTDEVNR